MNLPNIIYRYKLHHIFFWLILFCGWFYFRYEDFTSVNKSLLVTFIKVVDLAMMVYFTNYFLIPRLLYKKRYLLFAISFFAIITASSLFKIYVLGNIIQPGHFVMFDGNFKSRVYNNVIPHFLLVSTGAAFKLLLDYAKAQRRIGEMAKEKAETELLFLKSQMNPHFLFNALNSVYFLIDKKNEQAREALHKFSEMLRYQLYEVNDETVPIEKEVNYLKDYIEVQRIRKENTIIDFTMKEDLHGFQIQPLLLIPFVENAFKHLSHFNNGKQNAINMNLHKQDDEMIFLIKNTTEGKQNSVIKEDGGIGLANVKRRLELLYPGKHQLLINDADGYFDVQLKLKID